jgi:hypothetical protein
MCCQVQTQRRQSVVNERSLLKRLHRVSAAEAAAFGSDRRINATNCLGAESSNDAITQQRRSFVEHLSVCT